MSPLSPPLSPPLRSPFEALLKVPLRSFPKKLQDRFLVLAFDFLHTLVISHPRVISRIVMMLPTLPDFPTSLQRSSRLHVLDNLWTEHKLLFQPIPCFPAEKPGSTPRKSSWPTLSSNEIAWHRACLGSSFPSLSLIHCMPSRPFRVRTTPCPSPTG